LKLQNLKLQIWPNPAQAGFEKIKPGATLVFFFLNIKNYHCHPHHYSVFILSDFSGPLQVRLDCLENLWGLMEQKQKEGY